jgi:hypothetical protein
MLPGQHASLAEPQAWQKVFAQTDPAVAHA